MLLLLKSACLFRVLLYKKKNRVIVLLLVFIGTLLYIFLLMTILKQYLYLLKKNKIKNTFNECILLLLKSVECYVVDIARN